MRIVEPPSQTIHNPARNRFAELADECDQIPATQDLRAAGMRDDHTTQEETPPRAVISDSVQFDMTHLDSDRTNSLSDTESCAQLERGPRLRLLWNPEQPSKKPMLRTATIRGS